VNAIATRFLPTVLLAVAFALPSAAATSSSNRETWYAVRIGDATVGTASERRDQKATGTVFQAHMNVRFTRLGTPLSMMVLTEEFTTPEGRLERARMESSVSNSSSTAVLDGDSVTYETHVGKTVNRRKFAWQAGAVPEVVASDRVTAWLHGAAPETTVTVFDIAEGGFRSQQYVRGKPSSERTDTGTIAVTEVGEFDDGATTVSSTIWFDTDGQAVKTVVRQLGVDITIERVSEDKLASIEIEPDFDIIRQSMVQCAAFPQPVGRVADVTLRLDFAGAPPAQSMDGPNQAEIHRDGDTVDLKLTRDTVNRLVASPDDLKPYLLPDRFVQSDAPELRAVADSLRAATNAEGWPLARVVARWVNGHIVHKTMEHGYSSALEVYHSCSGDCTEHSLLTVAVLRAAGIPARPVVGLAFDQPEGAFVGHMWVEAYVDYWRTLDALDLDLDPIRLRIHAPESSESLGERDLLRAYGAVAGVSVRAIDHHMN
jgi:Transglutaminase-like superfamily